MWDRAGPVLYGAAVVSPMRHRHPYRLLSVAVAVCSLLVVAVAPAAAHGVTARFDAPVPLRAVYLGAGLTVVASAALVGRLDATPRLAGRIGVLPPRPAAVGRGAARIGFLVTFVAVLLHGIVGPRAPTGNFATLFTWAVWLKGVGIVAVVVGSPWAVLSPWRTAYDAVCRVEGSEISVRPYPAWLGRWPALAGFLVLAGVAENLTRIPQRPTLTAAVVAAYALVMFAGGLAFGRSWFDHADAFAVLYGLLGRVAPASVRRDDDGSVAVVRRYPWEGCTVPAADGATAAFVVAAIYTVTFDGFVESPAYRGLYAGAREVVSGDAATSLLLSAVGLVGFLVAFRGVAALVGRIARGSQPLPATDRDARPESDGGPGVPVTALLAPTLVPIVAGYEVAHNLVYVLASVGRLPRLVGADAVDPLWWLPLPAFWALQIVCLVGGHVVAVAAADAVIRRLAPTGRLAAAAHTPHLALMVGYTVVSLWVISLPVAA